MHLFGHMPKPDVMHKSVGGSDPDANIRLAAAIDRGKAANLPRDNIENAIKRATESSTGTLRPCAVILLPPGIIIIWFAPAVVLSGDHGDGVVRRSRSRWHGCVGAWCRGCVCDCCVYAFPGIDTPAVQIKALTDNRKRTAPALRSAFSKSGGELGTSGSVAWMFETTGRLAVPLGDGVDADDIMEAAVGCNAVVCGEGARSHPRACVPQIEAGADDVLLGDAEVTVVLSDPKDLATVKDALSDSGYAPSSVSVEREPQVRCHRASMQCLVCCASP